MQLVSLVREEMRGVRHGMAQLTATYCADNAVSNALLHCRRQSQVCTHLLCKLLGRDSTLKHIPRKLFVHTVACSHTYSTTCKW